ncbi:MAG: hypothetical protein KBD05_00680 [Candidatus Pacebacteria bacterium]|nr:hypothetical protein [Candidatus Paceibacterota bacterium]
MSEGANEIPDRTPEGGPKKERSPRGLSEMLYKAGDDLLEAKGLKGKGILIRPAGYIQNRTLARIFHVHKGLPLLEDREKKRIGARDTWVYGPKASKEIMRMAVDALMDPKFTTGIYTYPKRFGSDWKAAALRELESSL